jgi:hypothetical protein
VRAAVTPQRNAEWFWFSCCNVAFGIESRGVLDSILYDASCHEIRLGLLSRGLLFLWPFNFVQCFYTSTAFQHEQF